MHMLFSSSIFIFGFLPIVLALYYTIFKKNRTAQNVLLTFSSLFFYAWGEPLFVLIMLGVIALDYILALTVNKYRNNKKMAKAFLAITAIANLSIFFIFKYLVFTLTNINSMLDIDLSIPNIALPIGISFFMFQAMSYVIDVYREKGEVQKNILNVALYISFFPQLIAGPIVRYETIANQIKNRKETFSDFTDGACRFIIGLGKKVLIANNIAIVADAAFEQQQLSVAFAWIGALAYTFQIFYDFSGYSDMALGLGKMFGFHFLENFNYPYISKSISEFWRRWHISLGTWFRDYVYFPLGGSRVNSKARLVFNLFVVWFLTGIWHGANWTFIIWGLIYFVLIATEKLTGFADKLKGFGHIYTLLFVILGWVLFRANDISHAANYISSMFGLSGNALIDDMAIFNLADNKYFFITALIFSLPIAPHLREKCKQNIIANIIYPVLLICIFILSVSYIIKGSYNPFIYFNF